MEKTSYQMRSFWRKKLKKEICTKSYKGKYQILGSKERNSIQRKSNHIQMKERYTI